MAGALALKAALDPICGEVRLKWPNDIYWQDKKLSGTLIETTVKGKTIERCVYGIGLNVNQTKFHSDAPNPVSLKHITGHETDTNLLLDNILQHFARFYTRATTGDTDTLTQEYNTALYRNDNRLHLFKDLNTGTVFKAMITGVDYSGILHLADMEGKERLYSLKELRHVL